MEWLALAVWLIIVAIALPLGLGAVLGRISLGIQAIAAIGGFALLIVICIEGLSAVAWVALGLAGLGALSTGVGAIGLTSESGAPMGFAAAEEQQAGLAGAQIIFYLVAVLITLLVALDIGLAG